MSYIDVMPMMEGDNIATIQTAFSHTPTMIEFENKLMNKKHNNDQILSDNAGKINNNLSKLLQKQNDEVNLIDSVKLSDKYVKQPIIPKQTDIYTLIETQNNNMFRTIMWIALVAIILYGTYWVYNNII